MNARVIKTNRQHGNCEVVTDNRIALVFALPAEVALQPGDALELGELRLDAPILARKVESSEAFSFVVRRRNAHDLQLPMRHGGSRTPSDGRLAGAEAPDA
jgi:Lhr-like helicase